MDVTDFDFEQGLPDQNELIKAWLPKIEKAAVSMTSEDKLQTFFLAGLRLSAKSKSLSGFNMMNIIQKAGYSRSTFFRLFEGYTEFLLKAYQLTCQLSVAVYASKLKGREMTLEEFCKFTTDIFYGANHAVPNEIPVMLYKDHGKSFKEFHPHLKLLAPIMLGYLRKNPPTANLNITEEELDGVIHLLDWDILKARLDPDEEFPSMAQYKRLRRMFYGTLNH